MPRPASEARQGGLWMRFVAPVEEELEESAPRVLMTTKTRRGVVEINRRRVQGNRSIRHWTTSGYQESN